MAVKTYDPAQVLITFNGFNISGIADGTFVQVARNEDAFTLQVGSGGEGVRSKSNNKSGTVTLTLIQSSDSNEILSGFAAADELSNSGSGPLMIKDNSGNSLYMAESAWVKKVADSEFAKEAGSREWVLETDILNSFVGSN